MLLLPLDGGIENPRCLGILSSVDRPFWLGSDPVTDCPIESVRVVDPDIEPVFVRNRPAVTVPSLAPSNSALQGEPRPLDGARRIRHLFVLEGGRGE